MRIEEGDFCLSPYKNIAHCHCKGEGGGGVLWSVLCLWDSLSVGGGVRRLIFVKVHFRIYICISRCLCKGEGEFCEGLISEMGVIVGGSGSGKGGKCCLSWEVFLSISIKTIITFNKYKTWCKDVLLPSCNYFFRTHFCLNIVLKYLFYIHLLNFLESNMLVGEPKQSISTLTILFTMWKKMCVHKLNTVHGFENIHAI